MKESSATQVLWQRGGSFSLRDLASQPKPLEIILLCANSLPCLLTLNPLQMFFVIEGTVCVTVGDNSFAFRSGGMFMVPRGITYSIENIMDSDAVLFFSQARWPTAVEVSDDDMTLVDRGDD
ncbi:Mif2/CENP-C like-domain-containing protein [Mycena sp. CBHHK59/15]|nr:Mif2/CENP-C like-domain-containing protein [Mycena sp. CBHHK59/15]